jgi:hypothetical protein
MRRTLKRSIESDFVVSYPINALVFEVSVNELSYFFGVILFASVFVPHVRRKNLLNPNKVSDRAGDVLWEKFSAKPNSIVEPR